MLLLLNVMVVPLILAWAIFSYAGIGEAVSQGLAAMTGRAHLATLSPFAAKVLTTLILFLAYEFAYFIDHWLSHNVEALWMFHRVHHTAETLTPLTNFRIHPIDSLVFANCVAIIGGAAAGLCLWGLGPAASPLALDGTNVLLFAFVCLLLHLQHSQLWIVLPGFWNRQIVGPAHHQLHHSRNPAHFNSNYGNSLAIFDRLAGTLRVPQSRSPRLKFGVAGLNHDPHSLGGALIAPVVDAFALLRPEPRAAQTARH